MSYSDIDLQRDDGVATVTLNRPEAMNRWTQRMGREMDAALRSLDADDAIRAVVITGAGTVFCAGADLGGAVDFEGRKGGGEPERRSALAFPVFLPRMMRKPVIAAVNGHAIGVGITFAMNCDVRFVARDAKIQFAFVRRGLIPELSSHVIVARVAGFSRAADLLLTGRMITGNDCVEMGLASHALPAGDVLSAARDYAREYFQAAPLSVALSKRLLWEGLTSSADEIDAKEFALFEWICRQPDAAEGIDAFLKKRNPQWRMSPSRDCPDLD